MSTKLLWTGLTLVVASHLLKLSSPWQFAGAIMMAIGVVSLWLESK